MFLTMNEYFDIQIKESLMKAKIDDMIALRQEREKLMYFYRGQQTYYDDYLLNLITEDDERKLWLKARLRTVNFTEKVIKQKSKTYRETPEVEVWQNESINKESSKKYNELLKQSNAGVIRKEIERCTIY